MRYVPSMSNVPSARMIGRGNWPWPHPTARLHPLPATDRQAPSPVHRPVASGLSPGPAGFGLQVSRPHATSAATNRRASRRLTTPYNADRTAIKAGQHSYVAPPVTHSGMEAVSKLPVHFSRVVEVRAPKREAVSMSRWLFATFSAVTAMDALSPRDFPTDTFTSITGSAGPLAFPLSSSH